MPTQQNGQTHSNNFLTFSKLKILTFWMPNPQNGQTHSNNLSAFADKLFECVWPFYGVGT